MGSPSFISYKRKKNSTRSNMTRTMIFSSTFEMKIYRKFSLCGFPRHTQTHTHQKTMYRKICAGVTPAHKSFHFFVGKNTLQKLLFSGFPCQLYIIRLSLSFECMLYTEITTVRYRHFTFALA